MTECTCRRCGEPFPLRQGTNYYCRPCGPLAKRETIAAWRKVHTEELHLYEAKRRPRHRQQQPGLELLSCSCGNSFVPRGSHHKYCTRACADRVYRQSKLKAIRSVAVVPVPRAPLVDYDFIIMEIMETARRARARIDAEAELAGMRISQKQERLAGILAGIRNPFAVP